MTTPSTRSLFESEMLQQVEAAEAAVRNAETCDDAVSADAARGHLENLLSLARRNGLSIESSLPSPNATSPSPVLSLITSLTTVVAEPDPAAAPAV
jgi:hypothetical protein